MGGGGGGDLAKLIIFRYWGMIGLYEEFSISMKYMGRGSVMWSTRMSMASTVLPLALALLDLGFCAVDIFKIQLCDCFHKTQAVLGKNGPNNDKHRYLVSSRGEEIKVDNA